MEEESSHVSEMIDLADSTEDKSKSSSLPVSSTFATPEIPEDLLHHDETSSLHNEGQILGQDYGYNSSASSAHQSMGSDIGGRDLDDEDLAQIHSRASSRSSISSLPASVLVHAPDGMKRSLAISAGPHEDMLQTHHWVDQNDKPDEEFKSIHGAIRDREVAFRKPSSVRAMQMYTEDEEDTDDYLKTPRRRGGKRTSDLSIRSAGSSPLKRSPYYSPTRSASRQKVKKEYPLVLLHCTLLPPSLPIPGLLGTPNQKILREVLPLEYWRRWKLLEGKVGSGVLRDRGVLISHPEDMYDLLEERLLESLELQRPRLHHGHFLHDEGDSEKEDNSATEESGTDDEQGESCPDCGGRVVTNSNHGRKWEIKVFAANGLMRAGAWAAAWKEMEKVDVEVGLWLPSDVRRELEKRLLDDELYSYERRFHMHHLPHEQTNEMITEAAQRPAREIMDSPDKHEPRLLASEKRLASPTPEARPAQEQRKPPPASTYHSKPAAEIELQTLLINYIRVLASDRRNVAIAMLSVLVVVLAIIRAQPQSSPRSDLRPFPQDMFDSFPMSSASIHSAYSVSEEDTMSSSIMSSATSATSESSMVAYSIPTSPLVMLEPESPTPSPEIAKVDSAQPSATLVTEVSDACIEDLSGSSLEVSQESGVPAADAELAEKAGETGQIGQIEQTEEDKKPKEPAAEQTEEPEEPEQAGKTGRTEQTEEDKETEEPEAEQTSGAQQVEEVEEAEHTGEAEQSEGLEDAEQAEDEQTADVEQAEHSEDAEKVEEAGTIGSAELEPQVESKDPTESVLKMEPVGGDEEEKTEEISKERKEEAES